MYKLYKTVVKHKSTYTVCRAGMVAAYLSDMSGTAAIYN